MDNTEDKIGGDSKLTPSGERYAQALSSWVNQRIFEAKAEGKKKSAMERAVSYDGAEDKLMKLTVWTSTLQRAIATSQVLWCGVVWCGVVWCGVVWCGVVWCGVVWCGV